MPAPRAFNEQTIFTTNGRSGERLADGWVPDCNSVL
jgi:hypothetical protein